MGKLRVYASIARYGRIDLKATLPADELQKKMPNGMLIMDTEQKTAETNNVLLRWR